MTIGQFGHAYAPISTLLYFMGMIIALSALASMIYFRWGSDTVFTNTVYVIYTFIGVLFFLFAGGGVYFDFPIPGAAWVVGLLLMGIAFGSLTTYILASQRDSVRIRHQRAK